MPDGPVRGWGVFSHGFTLGKDSPAAARLCKQLAADGIGMLRFDALAHLVPAIGLLRIRSPPGQYEGKGGGSEQYATYHAGHRSDSLLIAR